MDELIVHCQVSLLKFITELSVALTTRHGITFEGLNLDSETTEGELPEGNIVGLEDFSYSERDDPVAIVTGQITVGTESDNNNEVLVRSLGLIISKTKALQRVALLHSETGNVIGDITFQGYRSVPPKFLGEKKIYQSVIFEAGILLDV